MTTTVDSGGAPPVPPSAALPQQEALDRRHMARALELAAKGSWRVAPNPKVGAVVARGEVVLAEGWHHEHGGPHAEVEAFSVLAGGGLDARGATLYVTLEPCGAFEGGA